MDVMVVRFWREGLKSLGKAMAVLACLTVGLFLWVTISFNRAQPSAREWTEASVLAKEMETYLSMGNEVVFAGASRGSITIEIYGLEDHGKQNKATEKLNELLKANPFQGRVLLKFYPSREYKSTFQNGWRVDDLIQKPAFREEVVQP